MATDCDQFCIGLDVQRLPGGRNQEGGGTEGQVTHEICHFQFTKNPLD